MKRLLLSALLCCGLMSGPEALGAQSGVEVDNTIGNRFVHQRLSVGRDGTFVNYFVVATDPDGLYPYCGTLQLERKTDDGWTQTAKSKNTYQHECYSTPQEAGRQQVTDGLVAMFLNPREGYARRLARGVLRIRAFSDLDATAMKFHL